MDVLTADLGPARPIVEAALDELARRNAVERLWVRDPALWKPRPEDQSEIADRLGWLTLPRDMRREISDLRAFADEVRGEGIRHVVLCGMGGSSLAPDVFRIMFGSASGYPYLLVLDSTDPRAVQGVDQAIDPARTLFLISSKSGGTIEVLSFLEHFWQTTAQRGRQFCAITDPGTSLERLAGERGFRRTFLNPPDIGGRYSALSLFGLVPAALIGMDLERLLASGDSASVFCGVTDTHLNPGAWLGAFMGGLARQGRDKMTLLTSPELASFGLWVEQLIAESTGKQGRGIIPIVGEPFLPPDTYGQDRCFAVLRLDGDDNAALDRLVDGLRGSFPLNVARLESTYDVGAEMYRWEVATALAGALLDINAFDQPNVQESKENTARVLEAVERSGPGALEDLPSGVRAVDPADSELQAFLGSAQPGDYVAFQAYVTPDAEVEAALQDARQALAAHLGVSTTLGFGPRFLHSTGQLHKGGPPSGLFVQIVHTPAYDLPVPGRHFTFGTLLAAQALGDLQSLRSRGLRVVRVDVGGDAVGGAKRLAAIADQESVRSK